MERRCSISWDRVRVMLILHLRSYFTLIEPALKTFVSLVLLDVALSAMSLLFHVYSETAIDNLYSHRTQLNPQSSETQ